MPEASDRPWFVRLLFRLTLGLAGALFLLVGLAPWIDSGLPHAEGWNLVLATFARDAVVRRTAVGSGVGLLATAFVFFRAPGGAPGSSLPPKPPRNIAGA